MQQGFYCYIPTCNLEKHTCTFTYQLVSSDRTHTPCNHTFVETIDWSTIQSPYRHDIDDTIVHAICAHMSIAFGMSYYKLAPTNNIIIPFCLSTSQKDFWHTMYIHGLGEYFFRNQIDPRGLCIVDDTPTEHIAGPFTIKRRNRSLIPIGGGKDSCVTIERYKKRDLDSDLFSFGKSYAVHEDIARAAAMDRLVVSRSLDPLLFDLNMQSIYYNGHVPITGMISFVSLLVSYLYDYHTVVMSNERSANYGNTVRHGYNINHQYSKSRAYEQAFNTYIANAISPQWHYTNELGSMRDAHVAREMAQHTHYFNVFSSCNRNFHISGSSGHHHQLCTHGSGRWCNQCPKCLFTYATMRPYISSHDVSIIWGSELYDDASLLPLFRELVGHKDIKPFECVGTPYEMHTVINAIIQDTTYAGYKGLMDAPLIKWYLQEYTSVCPYPKH